MVAELKVWFYEYFSYVNEGYFTFSQSRALVDISRIYRGNIIYNCILGGTVL